MWKYFGLLLCLCCTWMPVSGQRTIALLNTPVRDLPASLVRTTSDQMQLDFQVHNGMVYLEGELNGERSLFILDTGAPTLVLNETPKPAADNGFEAYSCVGEVRVGSRVVSSFSWGGQKHHQVDALTLNMSHLGKSEHQPRGLIGYELFKNQVLCLDYTQERLTLLSRKHWKHMQRLSEPLARFPLQFYGHLPVIELREGEHRFFLGIDTGAAANLINPAALQVYANEPSMRPREELQGLDQRVQVVDAVRLSGLWAQQQAPHRFLLTDMTTLNVDSNWQLDGLLGYEFLSRYRVVIDYPNGELSIWPL